MKTLIVFYSLTGNNKKVANEIANATGGKMLEIKTKKKIGSGPMRYFWAGKQLMAKETPEILPFDVNPADYDLIFIGTPVWGGNFAPAIKSFLKKTKLQKKKIALFSAHGGELAKTFELLKKEISANGEGNEIAGEFDFQMAGAPPDQVRKSLEDTAKWAKDIVGKI